MDSFPSNDNDNPFSNDINITIWIETNGRKKNTYISGWTLSDDQLKEHLKVIKKKVCCNGTVKFLENEISNTKIKVVQLQGNHIDYIINYLTNNGIKNIKVKGL